MALHVVILAAGKGTRMRSALPKVLQPLGEQSLLAHVIDSAAQLKPTAIHVIYGFAGERVKQQLENYQVNWVEQTEQLGTGHAVAKALPEIPDNDQVLVLYGDVPLILPQTLEQLVAAAQGRGLSLLTANMTDPSGYGRIIRDADQNICAIVEQKDATPEQLLITETNTGLLCGQAGAFKRWLGQVDNDNAQQEYYLTDCIALAVQERLEVVGVQPQSLDEVHGVNDKVALASAERLLQKRRAQQLLKQGLTLRDPNRIDVRGELIAGQDCEIDVNCVFVGQVKLGENVTIGANCKLKDCQIGDYAVIADNTVIDQAQVGRDCQVGPFARLRPGAQLEAKAKVGNYVEIKKSVIGPGSKVNHLSYVGDTQMGQGVNIGAGVITCNYDGVNKFKTIIGDHAFIGSDVQLIAPVEVGAGATIGAGTSLTKSAPEGQLTLSRAKQTTIKGWQRPTKKDKE